jgi:hypothetical protein
MTNNNQININKIVTEAIKGFKSWWIPLCSITAIIFLSQSWLPHFLFNSLINKEKINELKLTLTTIKDKAITTGDPDAVIEQFKTSAIHLYSQPEMHIFLNTLLLKISFILAIIALLLCFLYIIVIIISKSSVINNNNKSYLKKDIKKSYLLSCSYFSLCIIKALMLLLPFIIPALYLLLKLSINDSSEIASAQSLSIFYHIFEMIGVLVFTFFLIVLSIYTYIRLYFTGFIITEESSNPFKAISKSWQLTKNHTKKLSLIFILTIIIDIISVVSIIGFIPGTGLKYTLRASAYKQCLNIRG